MRERCFLILNSSFVIDLVPHPRPLPKSRFAADGGPPGLMERYALDGVNFFLDLYVLIVYLCTSKQYNHGYKADLKIEKASY